MYYGSSNRAYLLFFPPSVPLVLAIRTKACLRWDHWACLKLSLWHDRPCRALRFYRKLALRLFFYTSATINISSIWALILENVWNSDLKEGLISKHPLVNEGMMSRHPRVNLWMFQSFDLCICMVMRLWTMLRIWIAVPHGLNSNVVINCIVLHIELTFIVGLVTLSCGRYCPELPPTICRTRPFWSISFVESFLLCRCRSCPALTPSICWME